MVAMSTATDKPDAETLAHPPVHATSVYPTEPFKLADTYSGLFPDDGRRYELLDGTVVEPSAVRVVPADLLADLEG
jgi:hypothetical protein